MASGGWARVLVAAVVAAVAGAGVWAAIGVAEGEDVRGASERMRHIANFDDGGTYRTGTDMAFWGNRLVLGNLDQGTGPTMTPSGGFRVMDISNPAAPGEIGQWACSGDQSDVSVWHDLVIVSVDKPTWEHCQKRREGEAADWEGLRLVSIANPAKPRLLQTVSTACGSHTHTIVPDPKRNRLWVYVLSYPLAGRYNPPGAMAKGCTAAQHGKFSVVEVPLWRPERAKVATTVELETNIGCHDVTVFRARKLAAAACLTESQIWDVREPAKPQIIGRVPNPPGLNLSHSTIFSNDGGTLVIGDELGGAAASPGCLTGDQRDVPGGLFFFDVAGARARAPKLVGTFKLPQRVASIFCTAHLFNVVPFEPGDPRDLLVTSWYTGATSIIDFSGVRDEQPKPPRQVAFTAPASPTVPDQQRREAAAWASYWYRGHVWTNNFDEDVNSLSPQSRGLDVFEVDDELVQGARWLPRLNPQLQETVTTPGTRP